MPTEREIPWKNLKELIEEKGCKNDSNNFILYEEKIISYGEVHRLSNIIANNFRKLGIKKGDHVLVFLYNSPDYILIWFALAKLGAVMIPVNTALSGDDLLFIVRHSDAETIVTEPELIDTYQAIRKKARIQREIIAGSEHSLDSMIAFEDLKEGSADNLDTRIEKFDPLCMIYTSGTTGKRKGVLLPHFSYINSGIEVTKYGQLRKNDRMFTSLPLYHIGAQVIVVMPAMIFDIEFALIRRFSASRYWDQIRKYRSNVIHCLIPMTHILYKQPEKANDGDNPVDRALGGGPKDIWEKFEKRFNLTYLAFYGLTETGCLTTYTPEDKPRKIGSIGLPVPFQRVEIVNEDDEVRPPYEQGEIVVRPEIPYSMMLQYYKDSEATVAAWKNLWFHTGDIGYKDEDGYLFFVGRRANVIRCKGENVSAEEVEQVMNGHRGVKESAIIGVPSEVGEEEIKAFIVPNKGSRVLPEELIRFCEERLAYFKVPRYIEFIDELPMVSGVNRIERYKLKQRGIGESWDREKAGYKLKKKYPAS